MKLSIKLKQSDINKIKRDAGRRQAKEMIDSSCTKHNVVRNKKKYTRKNKHKSKYQYYVVFGICSIG